MSDALLYTCGSSIPSLLEVRNYLNNYFPMYTFLIFCRLGVENTRKVTVKIVIKFTDCDRIKLLEMWIFWDIVINKTAKITNNRLVSLAEFVLKKDRMM